MRNRQHILLAAALAAIIGTLLWAQSVLLIVEIDGPHLRVAAPQLRFLEGKPLEQLHNGASLTYALKLTIAPARGLPLTRLEERFGVSYDLWEEKFSVVQAGPPRRSASHLSAAQAVAWCLENMPLPRPELPAEKTFVVELECRVAENEVEGANEGRRSLTVAGLIDIFSRKETDALPRWHATSGLLRLADLKDRQNQKRPAESARPGARPGVIKR